MKTTLRGLCVVALLCITPSPAPAAGDRVEIEAADGFGLVGSYYAASAAGPGVLLLHQCNQDRRSYDAFAERLQEAGFHALSLDFRGYGDSRDAETGSFRENRDALYPHWETDVEAAFAFLSSRPGVDGKRIGALGASCGGSQAALLAKRHPQVKTVVLLSSSLPWVSLDEIKDFAASNAVPFLGIASEDDRGTLENTRQVFEASSSGDSRLILYKGAAHGTPLFEHDTTLEEAIVGWFRTHLGV